MDEIKLVAGSRNLNKVDYFFMQFALFFSKINNKGHYNQSEILSSESLA